MDMVFDFVLFFYLLSNEWVASLEELEILVGILNG